MTETSAEMVWRCLFVFGPVSEWTKQSLPPFQELSRSPRRISGQPCREEVQGNDKRQRK